MPDARISTSSGELLVRARFELKDVLKAIPGARWVKDAKAWAYPMSPASALSIEQAIGHFDLVWDRESLALLDEARVIERAADLKSAGGLPDVPRTRLPAWEHQRQAYWFMKEVLHLD